jgi:type II secretory pathway pseudopilin PulG
MAKGKGKVKREATPILPVSHQDAAAGSSTGQPSAKRPRKSNDSTKAGSSLSASDTLTRKGDGQQTLSRAQARQQNRQAAARERRRQQQGVTAERLEAQHANPQYIHNNLSKSYLKILQRVKDDFMISEGQTILFSTSWKTKDDVFVAKGSHPDFACIAAYLQDYVETSDGVLGTTMSLARMETIVTELSVCFYRGTHRKLSPSLLASVRAHVRGKMTTGNGKNNLTTLTREKNFIEAPDLADLAKAYLDERHTSLNLRARIQDLFLLSALTDNTLRIGSLVPKDCEDDRHLTWKNLRLVITKNPNAGQDNLLSIELFTLGGKTRESQHLQAIFDHADHFWSDTCLLLLILAHYDDALPTGWDMQRLLDPLVFGSLTGSDTLTLDFDAQSDDKFVLVSDFNYPKHLEYKAALHALQRAGDLCGFDCVMRFHVLRRTGVILLRLRGKTAQEIQQQLRHKWATSTYLVYVQRML